MMKRNLVIILSLTLLITSGCVTVPRGPSVMALPGQGKTFEQFQADDALCRQWAGQQIGLSVQETANQNVTQGAVAGTVIGAGLGAAIGAASGHVGSGAAIGAGSGLLLGTAAGASSGQYYGYQAQRRYDIAYTQCMYAKGNDVPGMVTRTRRPRRLAPPPPPAGSEYPSGNPYAPPDEEK
ncbi:MAG TPA: YMGG-like glycine zipper-containing protein [Thermodesulfovibrionales bacterium]|nr:YMGG-like glycine zipper-containing protein [Thermodesulfovibrionales bacterium]